jgi:hypothetical protein
MGPLQPIVTALPTLAVATVYCFWNVYYAVQKKRERRLRERVTFMLWEMANQIE